MFDFGKIASKSGPNFGSFPSPFWGQKTGPLRGPVSSENTRKYNGFGAFGRSKMDTFLGRFGVILVSFWGHFGSFWGHCAPLGQATFVGPPSRMLPGLPEGPWRILDPFWGPRVVNEMEILRASIYFAILGVRGIKNKWKS